MFVCGKINAFLLAAVISICVAFLLELLAVALPNWTEVEQTGTKDSYFGLFQVCVSITNHDHVCRYYSQANVTTSDWMKANAAMQVIGLACIIVSLVCGFLALICFSKRPLVFLIAAVFAFVAALFILIGIIVFWAKNTQGAEDFHASFYLAWFALTFAVVAGIFFIVAKTVQFV